MPAGKLVKIQPKSFTPYEPSLEWSSDQVFAFNKAIQANGSVSFQASVRSSVHPGLTDLFTGNYFPYVQTANKGSGAVEIAGILRPATPRLGASLSDCLKSRTVT